MADLYPAPTLSMDGWVRNTQKKADYLLAHFLVSEYSQDPLHDGIASFPWLIATYGDSDIDLVANTQDALQSYLAKYFPRADVRCAVERINGNPHHIRLRIEASVEDHTGANFDLNEIARIENSKVVEFAKLNNGSLPYLL